MSRDDKGETAIVREAAADVQSHVSSVGPVKEKEEERKEEDRKRGKQEGVRLCLQQKLSSAVDGHQQKVSSRCP